MRFLFPVYCDSGVDLDVGSISAALSESYFFSIAKVWLLGEDRSLLKINIWDLKEVLPSKQ